MIKAAVIVLFIMGFEVCEGGIGDDLRTFFDTVGSSVSYSHPGAFKSQAAGYFTGGGISIRNRSKNIKLIDLQLPSLRAGCGGIDIFAGGFSFISSEELVNALKAVASNAVSYAFMLAMKTLTPSIESLIAELQEMANFINQASINSCEIAANLVGGLWPKGDIASRHVCSSIKSSFGEVSDWVQAKHNCSSLKEGVYGSMKQKDKKSEYQDMLVDQFNVAWEVIKKNKYIREDKNLAELCKTLTGTIVAVKKGENRRVKTYPGKADNDGIIKMLFAGGEGEIYSCVKEFDTHGKCLEVEPKSINMNNSGLEKKVRDMLYSISNKAANDSPLSESEKNFISNTRLPIYKLINVMLAYKRAEIDLSDYVDIISIDLVHYNVRELGKPKKRKIINKDDFPNLNDFMENPNIIQ